MEVENGRGILSSCRTKDREPSKYLNHLNRDVTIIECSLTAAAEKHKA